MAEGDIAEAVTQKARGLIGFAHPALERARVAPAMLKAAGALPAFPVRDLYDLYPDMTIDVLAEQVALAVSDLSGEDFANVSFCVRRGEAVGITGATSSGRIGVAEAVAGLGRFSSGSIRIDATELRCADVAAALALGVGCVPKSRHRQGLVLGLSVADNTTMTISQKLGRFGFISPRRKAEAAQRAIASLGIVTAGADQPVSSLSGGNQQKAVMARALASSPSVLVLMDPTAGVDGNPSRRCWPRWIDRLEQGRAGGQWRD